MSFFEMFRNVLRYRRPEWGPYYRILRESLKLHWKLAK